MQEQPQPASYCADCTLGNSLRRCISRQPWRGSPAKAELLQPFADRPPCCTVAFILFLCYSCTDIDGFIASLRDMFAAE